MKKELIYELVEKGYKGGPEYDKFVQEFIYQLRVENYMEMSEVIQKIQNENNVVIKTKKKKPDNSFYLLDDLSSQIEFIKLGYQKDLIHKILLHGKPGTGKTSFVNYLSKTLKLPVVSISLSDILDFKYGESIKNLELIMNNYQNEKCIVFFDEAESLFKSRGTRNDVFETDRILTTMLKELDKSNIKPLFVFATNLYDSLDKAFIRRMDEIINFDIYDKKDYLHILDIFAKRYEVHLDDSEYKLINSYIFNNIKTISPSSLELLIKKIAINSFKKEKLSVQKIIDQFGGKNAN